MRTTRSAGIFAFASVSVTRLAQPVPQFVRRERGVARHRRALDDLPAQIGHRHPLPAPGDLDAHDVPPGGEHRVPLPAEVEPPERIISVVGPLRLHGPPSGGSTE